MATAPTLIGQYKLWLSAYTISLEQGAFLWDTRLGLDEMREDPRFLDRGTRGSEPLLRMLEPDEQSARTRHSVCAVCRHKRRRNTGKVRPLATGEITRASH